MFKFFNKLFIININNVPARAQEDALEAKQDGSTAFGAFGVSTFQRSRCKSSILLIASKCFPEKMQKFYNKNIYR